MTRTIRRFLLLEAAAFLAASLVHGGWPISGYEHREARIAETTIVIVLLAGVGFSLLRPAWTRGAGLAAQGFAMLGTLVGAFTIAVGVGPRTVPDVVYHGLLLALLAWGLVDTTRARADAGARST